MRHLDWRSHSTGTQRMPCRVCGRGAFMRDEHGRPCHKVCAEQLAEPVADPATEAPSLLAPVVDLASYRRARPGRRDLGARAAGG